MKLYAIIALLASALAMLSGCGADAPPGESSNIDPWASGAFCAEKHCVDGSCYYVQIGEGAYCIRVDGSGGICENHECRAVDTCPDVGLPEDGADCTSASDCCPAGPCFKQICPLGSRRCVTEVSKDGTPCDGGTCVDGECRVQ